MSHGKLVAARTMTVLEGSSFDTPTPDVQSKKRVKPLSLFGFPLSCHNPLSFSFFSSVVCCFLGGRGVMLFKMIQMYTVSNTPIK